MYEIPPVLKNIYFQGQHTANLPSSLFFFFFCLSPPTQKKSSNTTCLLTCMEICIIEYWWTEVYVLFLCLFFPVIFLFVPCILRKKKFKWIVLYIHKKTNHKYCSPCLLMAFSFSFSNPCRLVSLFCFHIFFYFVKIYKY